MKRDLGLRPRKSKELPPEKLLEILMGIYPADVALELFKQMTKKKGKD
jgi:hypothetical protein